MIRITGEKDFIQPVLFAGDIYRGRLLGAVPGEVQDQPISPLSAIRDSADGIEN